MRPMTDSPKLPMSKSSVLQMLVVLTLVVSMSACSMFKSKGDTIDTMPVAALYDNAHSSLENADYAAASKAYQRLIARFPSGEYNEQARLDLDRKSTRLNSSHTCA